MIFDLKQARVVIFKTISTADLRGYLGGQEFALSQSSCNIESHHRKLVACQPPRLPRRLKNCVL